MAFRTVFRVLQEVFPQIDIRMLKAVAIEYSKDVDAAVDFVLSDVLPVIETTEKAPSVVTYEKEYPAPDGRTARPGNDFKYQEGEANTSVLPGSKSDSETLVHDVHPGVSYASSSIQRGEGSHSGETIVSNLLPTVEQNDLSNSFQKIYSCSPQASGSKDNLSNKSEPYAQSMQHFDHMASGISDSNFVVDSVSSADLGEVNASLEVVQTPQSIIGGWDNKHSFDSNLGNSSNLVNLIDFGTEWENNMIGYTNENEKQPSEPSNDIAHVQGKCTLQVDTSFFPCLTSVLDDLSPMETFPESLANVNGVTTSVTSAQSHSEGEPRCLDGSTLSASENETISAGNYSQTAIAGTGSSQISVIDNLEDSIIGVEGSKMELVLELDSAAQKLKQVEINEETAKKAREEAFMASQDIFRKVEKLQQMAQQAKEANEKNAGEIYGERTVMANEAREIQCRLINILDEKNKYLSIIDQIHQTLDARLATADKERIEAEKEKVEIERLASEALHEQEIIMENIKLESERLQQESLKNLKLRKFLVESGRNVDALQQEIAVVCSDVLMLQERIEVAAPPFKKPILAEPQSPASPANTSRDKEQHLESSNDAHKDFTDDDWEIFDSKAELCG